MSEYSVAPLYDLLLFPFVFKLRRRILRICLDRGYESVLDVCCGTGNQLKILKRHGFNAQGVDLSPEMLEVSKKGKHAPPCRLEDARRMTFPDNSFPMAMTTFALHEKERDVSLAILSEMQRVVKPEGDLLLVDFHFTEKTSPLSRKVITMIEGSAGEEHYANFQAYTASGGLPELVRGLPLEQTSLEIAGMGGIGLFLFRNKI
jgi:demethylmenaquinone methyltransferase/2-methoxy-6-polyprenyl-1,4-benzoquinol methylase